MATHMQDKLLNEYEALYGNMDDRQRDELLKELEADGTLRFDWEHGYTQLSATHMGAVVAEVSGRHYLATVYWGASGQYALALTGEGWNEDEGEWREVTLVREGQADALLRIMEELAGLEIELGLEDVG